MPHLEKEHIIKAKDFIHAGQGSVQLKRTLKSVGFPAEIIQRASICAYEAEMNVVMHGGNGVLTFRLDEDEVFIEVEDDGPGIPDSLQDSVFYPLVTSRPEGTGLGLPVAQDLISRHGGLIEFESRPGRTVFQVRIPLLQGEDRHG